MVTCAGNMCPFAGNQTSTKSQGPSRGDKRYGFTKKRNGCDSQSFYKDIKDIKEWLFEKLL